MLENIKDGGSKHVAAQNGVAGKLFLQRGLFVHVAYTVYPVTQLLFQLYGGVLDYKLVRHLAHGDSAALIGLGGLHQLFENGLFAEHDIVAQQYGKGLIAHKALGAPYGVAQTLCLLLAQEKHIRHIRHIVHYLSVFQLAVSLEALFQIGGIVKVVLNGVFAPVCDDENFLNTGGHGLFNDVLDNGLVHQRQHLLGNTLGVGQHT